MPILTAHVPPSGVGSSIEVFDLGGGILRLLAGPADTNQRLRLYVMAELNELLDANEVRVEATPRLGCVRHAVVPVSETLVPFEDFKGAATKANDAWAHGGQGVHNVGPPDAEHGLFVD